MQKNSQKEQQPWEKVVKKRKSVLVYDNNQEPVDGQLIVRVATISDSELESDNLTSENNPVILEQSEKMFYKEQSRGYSDCRKSREHSQSGGAGRSASRPRRESDQHHRALSSKTEQHRRRSQQDQDLHQYHLEHLINRK